MGDGNVLLFLCESKIKNIATNRNLRFLIVLKIKAGRRNRFCPPSIKSEQYSEK